MTAVPHYILRLLTMLVLVSLECEWLQSSTVFLHCWQVLTFTLQFVSSCCASLHFQPTENAILGSSEGKFLNLFQVCSQCLFLALQNVRSYYAYLHAQFANNAYPCFSGCEQLQPLVISTLLTMPVLGQLVSTTVLHCIQIYCPLTIPVRRWVAIFPAMPFPEDNSCLCHFHDQTHLWPSRM